MHDPSERRVRIYRLLLRLFPRDFRERWGPDMEAVWLYRVQSAHKRPVRLAKVWMGIIADTVAGAAGEWWRRAAEGSARGGAGMGPLAVDLKQAVRGLSKAPAVTGIAILTLALGIGAITTTFSVVDGVLLKPLPYDEPDRIVSVWPSANFNIAMVREVDAGAPALESVAGMTTWSSVLSGIGHPEEIDVARVSPVFFSLLGVPPALGRTLVPGDDRADDAAVVVISHELWISRFGSDPDVLGRAIQLSVADHDVHTVVGVMPRHFESPVEALAWTPLVDDPSLSVVDDASWYVNDRIARLAPGATLSQASRQVRELAERLAPEVPNQFGPDQIAAAGVVPLKDDLIEDTRAALWILLGAVGLVLLIACANVANLLLARGEARRHDLAVRASLGATRAGIIRLLLVETALLGIVGGALGIFTALGLVEVVVALAPSDIPRVDQVTVDWAVLAFALGVTLVATLTSGLWPAWRASRGELATELGGSSRGASRGASRVVSHALIGAEMALAVVVTLGSGLMLRSLNELMSVDIGFEPQGVVAFRPNPDGSGREGAESYRQFYAELMEQTAAAPGVRSVSAVQILTGTPNNWSFPTFPEGYQIPATGALPDVNFRAVMPDYFETLRIPLLQGRTITPSDRADSEPIAVVNRAFVETFWPGQEAIGKTLNILGTDANPHRVVGVVGDIRQHALNLDPRPELYVPFMSWPWQMSAWVLARTDAPDQLKPAVRELVDRVDPNVPVSGVDDLDRVLDRSAAETRFFTILLTAFGVLGLTLGAIGIYGVTAYSVVRRRAEFGVRLALGATRGNVIGAALRQGVTPIVVGAVSGVLLGLAGSRFLRSFLYGVEPFDPPTLLAVTAALALVATAALAVPAWRAGRVNPVEVLSSG